MVADGKVSGFTVVKKDLNCGVVLELWSRFDINEYGADLPPRSRTRALAGRSLSVNKTMNGL